MKSTAPACVLILVLAVFVTSCASTDKGEKPLGSVEIHGNTPGQIRAAAIEVFRAHGYDVSQSPRNRLICEKPASKWTDLAYGGWGGDAPLYLRVAVSIVPVADQTCRVECQVYRVEDRGGPTEKAMPLGKSHSGNYQKLLEEIAGRFRTGSANKS